MTRTSLEHYHAERRCALRFPENAHIEVFPAGTDAPHSRLKMHEANADGLPLCGQPILPALGRDDVIAAQFGPGLVTCLHCAADTREYVAEPTDVKVCPIHHIALAGNGTCDLCE